MMTEPELKTARRKDLGRLLELVHLYHESLGESRSKQSWESVLKPLLGNSDIGRIWLIKVDNKTIGYIALCFGYSIEFGARDAFVDEFFIVESKRGQGYGRTVLNMVCEKVILLGVSVLHLEVSTTNLPAQKLYSSIGFELRNKYHLMTCKLA